MYLHFHLGVPLTPWLLRHDIVKSAGRIGETHESLDGISAPPRKKDEWSGEQNGRG